MEVSCEAWMRSSMSYLYLNRVLTDALMSNLNWAQPDIIIHLERAITLMSVRHLRSA